MGELNTRVAPRRSLFVDIMATEELKQYIMKLYHAIKNYSWDVCKWCWAFLKACYNHVLHSSSWTVEQYFERYKECMKDAGFSTPGPTTLAVMQTAWGIIKVIIVFLSAIVKSAAPGQWASGPPSIDDLMCFVPQPGPTPDIHFA